MMMNTVMPWPIGSPVSPGVRYWQIHLILDVRNVEDAMGARWVICTRLLTWRMPTWVLPRLLLLAFRLWIVCQVFCPNTTFCCFFLSLFFFWVHHHWGHVSLFARELVAGIPECLGKLRTVNTNVSLMSLYHDKKKLMLFYIIFLQRWPSNLFYISSSLLHLSICRGIWRGIWPPLVILAISILMKVLPPPHNLDMTHKS